MSDDAAPEESRVRKVWRDWFKPLLIAILVIAPFRSAVADWNDVPTGSMKPTILEGDRIVVNKLAYDLKVPFTTWHVAEWSGPSNGDVVVCLSPKDGIRLVKRVIGVAGDSVVMRGNRLLINDRASVYTPLAPAAVPWIQPRAHTFHRERLTAQDTGHSVMFRRSRSAGRDFGPVTVPAGHYLVMGDNRDNSFDSRGFGFVPRESILGKATAVAMSFDLNSNFSPRWERFFTALD
jgi:signal peptidase I